LQSYHHSCIPNDGCAMSRYCNLSGGGKQFTFSLGLKSNSLFFLSSKTLWFTRSSLVQGVKYCTVRTVLVQCVTNCSCCFGYINKKMSSKTNPICHRHPAAERIVAHILFPQNPYRSENIISFLQPTQLGASKNRRNLVNHVHDTCGFLENMNCVI